MSKLTASEISKVFTALVGPISPVGDANQDEYRLNNLRSLEFILSNVITQLLNISEYKNNHQASVKKIGSEAQGILQFIAKRCEGDE